MAFTRKGLNVNAALGYVSIILYKSHTNIANKQLAQEKHKKAHKIKLN